MHGVSKTYKTVPFISMTEPMVAEEAYHDQSTKVLLNGKINIPAGQSTEDDIKKVVSGLMQHPNTAPFIAKKMIQQLVTSNPSPAYVAAAASAFGTTGNMKAMIESILTHSEATQGKKLKSPFLRATQILKAFSAYNRSGKLWVIGDQMDYLLQQHVLSSPTVFNFYLPDYVPHGPIEDANMVAPEFQIHNSATSIAYVNLMYNWIFGGILPTVSTVISSTRTNVPELDWEVLEQYTNDKLYLDLSYEISLARREKFDKLISHIALKLIGRSNIDFAQTIKSSFSNYTNQPEWVVQTIIFMIVISPEFAVLKG